MDRVIGYNVRGPLHTSHPDMHETLFHELIHLNDGEGSQTWSGGGLRPILACDPR